VAEGSAAASEDLAAAAAVVVAGAQAGRMELMRTSRRVAVQLLALGLLAVPLSGCSYNKFVSQEEAVKAQWAQVQNQLQRRNDLIPNLVETVKGYATHEESVFKEIAESRSRLLNAKSPADQIAAANQQSAALG